jgi:hypothetical protein
MFAFSSPAGCLPTWTVLFAREPEPELDLDEDVEDLGEDTTPSYPGRKPPKRRGRPFLWLFLLIVLGGAVYLVMKPEIVMDLLGLWVGDIPPAPTVARPPAGIPSPPPPAQPGTPTPPSAPPQPTGPAAPLTTSVPPPLFSQGQRVALLPDPAVPGGAMSLTADPAGLRPGPAVSPAAVLTVVDGELQNNLWMYSVRTEEGTTGWIPERRLRANP